MVKKVSDRKLRQQEREAQAEAIEQNQADSKEVDDPFKTKGQFIWVVLTFFMMVTLLVTMLYSKLGVWEMYGGMLGCGLFGAAVVRYKHGNGFLGFGIGSLSGLLLYFAMVFLIVPAAG